MVSKYKILRMVKQHVNVAPICYRNILEEEGYERTTIYMIKSIERSDQSYNVTQDTEMSWTCDCPSFKYQTGTTDEGYCKHIVFVRFLLKNEMKIPDV